jgi:hypothetical protein
MAAREVSQAKGPRMVSMRVLRGTVVAGGQDHGPGAAVEIPEAEADELAALGICAFAEADELAALGICAFADAGDSVPGAEGDESHDPTAG